jgi:hypothetical protein
MQRDRAHVAFIHVLVDLEYIAFVIDGGVHGLVKRWQAAANQIHDRAVHGRDRPDGHPMVDVYRFRLATHLESDFSRIMETLYLPYG